MDEALRTQSTYDLGQLRLLFQRGPAAVAWLHGPRHEFRFVNDSYQALVGSRDLIGKSVADGLPELAERGFVRRLDEVYATGEPYIGNEVRVPLRRLPDGSIEERVVA